MTSRVVTTIHYGRGRRIQTIVENWRCKECGTGWKEIILPENSRAIECPLCHAIESLPDPEP